MNWNLAAEEFVNALSSSNPTPGGGAAAAMAGAMGSALALMAIGTTLKRKTLPPDVRARLEMGVKTISALQTQLKQYIQLDAQAYQSYINAKKLSLEDSSRADALEQALYQAACVPVETAQTALRVLNTLHPLESAIAPIIFSDVLCAKHLLQTCVRCAAENIRTNLSYIQNKTQQTQLRGQLALLEKEL